MALAEREGRTGTYGGVTVEFPGFQAHIDASVGYMSNHRVEADRYREKLATAEKTLAEARPQLEQLLRHFRTGTHPHTRLRRYLLETKPQGFESNRIDFRFPQPAAKTDILAPVISYKREIQLRLYIDPALSKPLSIKLMMDLCLSQLWPGGVLAKVEPSSDRPSDLGQAQSLLAGLLPALNGDDPSIYECAIYLLRAREQEAQIRKVAALAKPVPAPTTWEQDLAPLGLFAAKAVVKTLDRKTIGNEWISAFQTLKPESAESAAILLLLMLRDDEWPDGMAPIFRVTQAIAKPQSMLQRYLEALQSFKAH